MTQHHLVLDIHKNSDDQVYVLFLHGFLNGYMIHAGIATSQFSLKLVAGKKFQAFLAHAKPVILRIW